MKKPTITTVRKTIEEHGARQGIVILFDGDRFAAASYGTTKAECGRVGKTLDAIADLLTAGKIPPPT